MKLTIVKHFFYFNAVSSNHELMEKYLLTICTTVPALNQLFFKGVWYKITILVSFST